MSKAHLKKELTLFTLVALGVGSMIGSGIFAMPAAMSAAAGPSLVVAFIIGGVIALFLGIAYAELGSAFPLTGGPYSLPRLALGDFGGFFIGWGYFLNAFIGTAAIINAFVLYLGYYIPGLAIKETLTPFGSMAAVILLWGLTYMNIMGIKWGGLYASITTIGRIAILVFFGFIGLFFFKGHNFTPFMPFGFTGLTLAITLVFWAYTGFETVVIPAEEVKNSKRNIPWAIILTILIVLFVYTFIACIFVGIIDWHGLHLGAKNWKAVGDLTSPMSSVTFAIGLPWLATIITIGAMVATGGAGGGWILLQGRLPYAMAKDDLFWKPLAKISEKHKTPTRSLIFASFLTTIVLIIIPDFPSVALIASITAAVSYATAVISVPILRKTKPKVHRPFKLQKPILITIIGFIFASFMIYWASWPWSMIGSITMLTGYLVFIFIKHDWEFKRNSWILVYLFGLIIVSLIGDPALTYKNFLPIQPLGWLKLPYDLIILAAFSVLIYFWIYKVNIKYKK